MKNENLSDLRKQYDLIGEEYIRGQEKFFSARNDWSREAIAKHLGDVQGRRILDVGCGAGTDVKLFENQGATVWGIDPSQKMINFAKARVLSPDHIRLGDYETIPFQDNSFDIVLGRFSLHNLKNLDKAYEEISRVLLSGSVMLQIVSHPLFDLTYRLEPGHGDTEFISVHLYDGEIRVQFPPHSFQDYFSQKFFELFTLEVVEEYIEEEARKLAVVPDALLYVARSK